jgi:hypothetical protein
MRTRSRFGGAVRGIALVSAVVIALISGVAVASVVGLEPVGAAPTQDPSAER